MSADRFSDPEARPIYGARIDAPPPHSPGDRVVKCPECESSWNLDRDGRCPGCDLSWEDVETAAEMYEEMIYREDVGEDE